MMGEGLGEPPLGTLNILVNSLVLPQNHLCIFFKKVKLKKKILYSVCAREFLFKVCQVELKVDL